MYPSSSRRPAHRVPTAEDARSDARKPATVQPRASSGARRNSPNWQTALKAHRLVTLDRCRRRRQDTAGTGGGRALGRRLPGRGVRDRTGRGRRSGRGARSSRGGTRHHPAAGMSLADSVAAALEGRSRLLVFDNCEHVLDAAADMIEAILNAFVDGEDSCHQPRGPAAGRRTTLAGAVSRCPGRRAATLFVERASAVAPSVSLSRRRRRCGRDLPPTRRDPARHRAGRFTPAVDDGHRGTRSPR